jgi:hypothetical protein
MDHAHIVALDTTKNLIAQTGLIQVLFLAADHRVSPEQLESGCRAWSESF